MSLVAMPGPDGMGPGHSALWAPEEEGAGLVSGRPVSATDPKGTSPCRAG